jgi:hypothetical protein
MAEIKLYQFGPIADRESASPFCVKLHYALRYKRLPFETVNLASPTQVKKYNPRGKLPVLIGAVAIAGMKKISADLSAAHLVDDWEEQD